MSDSGTESNSPGTSLIAKARENVAIDKNKIKPLKESLLYTTDPGRKGRSSPSERRALVKSLTEAYAEQGMSPQAAKEKAENDANG